MPTAAQTIASAVNSTARSAHRGCSNPVSSPVSRSGRPPPACRPALRVPAAPLPLLRLAHMASSRRRPRSHADAAIPSAVAPRNHTIVTSGPRQDHAAPNTTEAAKCESARTVVTSAMPVVRSSTGTTLLTERGEHAVGRGVEQAHEAEHTDEDPDPG